MKICFLALSLSLVLAGTVPAVAEEPSANQIPPSAGSMTPAVPVTPGRPHGRSYDPHVKLDPETQIRIALQHKAEGRPQEALHTLTQASDRNPDNARLFAVRGSLLLEEGRIAPALADLEKSVRLDPDDAEVLTNRAQAYRRFGRMDEALEDLDRAVALQPDLLAARFNRGAMRYGLRDYSGALEDFDHCIALDPHLPGPYFNRAAVQDALGDKDAAIRDLDRFLQVSDNADWNRQAEELLQVLKDPDSVPDAPPPSPH